MMSNGKDPAPLPMYERIVLKHVSTMVRRRYDSGLVNLIQDLPSKDSRSEDDGDVNPGFASDVDDGADYEVEDLTLLEDDTHANCDTSYEAEDVTQLEDDTRANCDTNYDTQTCTEHKPTASMNSADSKSTNDVAEGGHLANSLDVTVENRYQNNEHEISENNAQDWKYEYVVALDADLANYVDSSAKTELQSNEHGLNVEGDGTKDANIDHYFVDDKVEHDVELGDSDNEIEITVTMKTFGKDAKKVNCPAPLPMYQPVTLKHVPTMVRRRYDKDLQKFYAAEGFASEESSESKGDGAEYANPASTLSEVDHNTENDTQIEDELANFYTEHDTQTYTEDFGSRDFTLSAGTYTEDGKSEVYGAEEVNLASSVDDSGKGTIQDHGHAKSDSDQASCSADCADKDDEAKDADLKNYVDASFDIEVQGNELGLKRYCDGTKDANVDSCYVDDSAEDKFHSKKHGGFDNHQGLQIEHCKSRDDGTKEADAATYYQDGCVEDDEKEYVNFDDEQGLHLQDSKSQGKEADEDENLATCVKMEVPHKGLEDTYCEHDFDPEPFKKTLERDGYDLCCPNCHRHVTKTMIFRRKEIVKQQETTCFSFLIALFRCIRW